MKEKVVSIPQRTVVGEDGIPGRFGKEKIIDAFQSIGVELNLPLNEESVGNLDDGQILSLAKIIFSNNKITSAEIYENNGSYGIRAFVDDEQEDLQT